MARLIQMILNRLMGQLINRGISAGINRIAGKGKDQSEMTPQERGQAQEARQTAKRARQAAGIARRFMR